jgi:hypothetical protein
MSRANELCMTSALPPPLPAFPNLPPPVPPLPPHLIAGATLLSDRNAILPLLPKGKVIAEVGVAVGDFSARLMSVCEPARFIAIDTFDLHKLPLFWGRPPAAWFGAQTHGAWYRAHFAKACPDVRVLEGDSAAMIAALEDASVDIFYLDADHAYAAVQRDLAALLPKVRPDGYVILNDYILIDQLRAEQPYGVIYAAHQFMLEHGWAMQYFALQTNMFCDVVLRRAELVTPLGTRLAALQQENVALRREAELLRGSTSWRLTAPLRAAARMLRRR